AIVLDGDARIDLVENHSQGDTVRINAKTPARIMFYTRYFPGWTATVDGSSVPVTPAGEQGLVTLNVPAGTHTVSTHWGTTAPRVIGGLISALALISIVLVLWRARPRG